MATREPGRTAGPNSWALLRLLVVLSASRRFGGASRWTVKSLRRFHTLKAGPDGCQTHPHQRRRGKGGNGGKEGGEGSDDAGEEGEGGSEVYWHTTGRLVNTYTGRVLAKVEGVS